MAPGRAYNRLKKTMPAAFVSAGIFPTINKCYVIALWPSSNRRPSVVNLHSLQVERDL